MTGPDPISLVMATFGAFTAFLPSAIAVRHHDPNDTRRIKDIRLGLLYGAVVSFGVAAYYAQKTDNVKPLAIWVLAAGGITVLYELSLRSSNDIDLRGGAA